MDPPRNCFTFLRSSFLKLRTTCCRVVTERETRLEALANRERAAAFRRQQILDVPPPSHFPIF